MKKETSIAIILGITFGVILSVVMVSRTNSKSNSVTNKNKSNEANLIVTPLPQTGTTFVFEITAPSNNIIVDKKTILLTGKTTPESLIVIQTPIKELVVKNIKTEFSAELPLALGENVIHVSVYPKDEQLKSQEKELRVYYMEQ